MRNETSFYSFPDLEDLSDERHHLIRFEGNFISFPSDVISEVIGETTFWTLKNIADLDENYAQFANSYPLANGAKTWYDREFSVTNLNNPSFKNLFRLLHERLNDFYLLDVSHSICEPRVPSGIVVLKRVSINDLQRIPSVRGEVLSCNLRDASGTIKAVWPVRTTPWSPWCVDSCLQYKQFSSNGGAKYDVFARAYSPDYEFSPNKIDSRGKGLLIEMINPSTSELPILSQDFFTHTPLAKLIFHKSN